MHLVWQPPSLRVRRWVQLSKRSISKIVVTRAEQEVSLKRRRLIRLLYFLTGTSKSGVQYKEPCGGSPICLMKTAWMKWRFCAFLIPHLSESPTSSYSQMRKMTCHSRLQTRLGLSIQNPSLQTTFWVCGAIRGFPKQFMLIQLLCFSRWCEF